MAFFLSKLEIFGPIIYSLHKNVFTTVNTILHIHFLTKGKQIHSSSAGPSLSSACASRIIYFLVSSVSSIN